MQLEKDSATGKTSVVKPELFAMSAVYNPRNELFIKASHKYRKNKIGVDHSSAALIDNAIGDDHVVSWRAGAHMSRLGTDEPLMNNLVVKASTELVTGDKTKLLKSKLFARLTKKLGEQPFYG